MQQDVKMDLSSIRRPCQYFSFSIIFVDTDFSIFLIFPLEKYYLQHLKRYIKHFQGQHETRYKKGSQLEKEPLLKTAIFTKNLQAAIHVNR